MNAAFPLQRRPACSAVREVGGFVFALLVSVLAANAADNGEGLASFEKRIRPVLVDKCYKCHAADAEKIKGGLLLDTRVDLRKGGDSGPALVPGEPGKSLLMTAIRHTDPDMKMPPKEKLPDSVIEDFRLWIKMGAPDPREGLSSAAPGMDIE